MKVFLDDIRQPPDDSWTVIRTGEELIELLRSGVVTELSLDHDLGEDVMTGYDVTKWIEEKVYTSDFRPPRFFIHSANPVGQKNMLRCIESIERR